MTFETLKKVLSKGDKYGSAFDEILDYYHIENKDLTKITEDMAKNWLERK